MYVNSFLTMNISMKLHSSVFNDVRMAKVSSAWSLDQISSFELCFILVCVGKILGTTTNTCCLS